jgi:hypothetical protein
MFSLTRPIKIVSLSSVEDSTIFFSQAQMTHRVVPHLRDYIEMCCENSVLNSSRYFLRCAAETRTDFL